MTETLTNSRDQQAPTCLRETHERVRSSKQRRGFGEGRYRFNQGELDRLRRLYETHGTFSAVTAITRVNPTTLRKYERAGWKVMPDPRLIPVPADLAINAAHMRKYELMEHYHCSCKTLYRWLREIGIQGLERSKAKRVYESLPIPPRHVIAEALRTMEVRDAAKHFGCCTLTLRKWRRFYGLPLRPRKRKASNNNCIGWVERYVQERRAA